MTPTTDLARTIQTADTGNGSCPARTANRPAARATEGNDTPRDPDWAIKVILDNVLFQRVN